MFRGGGARKEYVLYLLEGEKEGVKERIREKEKRVAFRKERKLGKIGWTRVLWGFLS